MNFIEELKHTFKEGSILTKLIYLNLGIFLIFRILNVFFFLVGYDFDVVLNQFTLPSSFSEFIYRPWTIVSYMFLHFDFLHILFNLLWLFWFGKIFLQYFDEKRLLGIYLMGGFTGGILYMLFYNVFPVYSGNTQAELLGASASILALVVASATYAPNYRINLMFFGPIKIMWIAVISVALYFIGISGSNSGGNVAHIGGAIWGFIYITQLKRGKDITSKFNNFVFKLSKNIRFKKRDKMHVSYRNNKTKTMSDWVYNQNKKKNNQDIDKILDKISKSGYDNLSKDEKDFLFKHSNKS